MLLEWNMEEAREAWLEKGREEGIEKGIGIGREEGIEKGIGIGREEGREEIVRNAITKGIPLDLIKEITGMDINSIQNIQAELA